MNSEIEALKDAVPLREVVLETHEIKPDRKVLCPFHSDTHPSCHIYPNRFKCFACGAHGDVLDWLGQVHNVNRAEAIRELKRRVGRYLPPIQFRPKNLNKPGLTFKAIDDGVLKAHQHLAEMLEHVPLSMHGRGFTLNDLKQLNFAAYGDDAVFPITGPDGSVLALKRRYSEPYKGQRYLYTTPGHGSPAWCSPNFLSGNDVLIVEGELNAMACFLARPDLSVMGVAGANGKLHLEALKGRTVFVYADGDLPGQAARERWAAQALEAGAQAVFILEPLPHTEDFCDVAGRQGRDAVRFVFTQSLTHVKPIQTLRAPAKPFAPFFADGDGAKPDPCKRAKGVWDRAHRRLI